MSVLLWFLMASRLSAITPAPIPHAVFADPKVFTDNYPCPQQDRHVLQKSLKIATDSLA